MLWRSNNSLLKVGLLTMSVSADFLSCFFHHSKNFGTIHGDESAYV